MFFEKQGNKIMAHFGLGEGNNFKQEIDTITGVVEDVCFSKPEGIMYSYTSENKCLAQIQNRDLERPVKEWYLNG